jgi:cysteine desulfurase/selenocysteine lyase
MQTVDRKLIDAAIRDQFPILATKVRSKPLTYLDNAATSQKPKFVLDALDHYWTGQNSNVHRGVHYLSQLATLEFDNARESVRRLLGAAEADEVVFTKGCTEGINLVASGLVHGSGDLRLGAGDAILVSTQEHHSNIVPWQLAAERTGARVIPIPVTDDGEIQLDAYLDLLKTARPKLVAVKHVCNALGTINPIKWMIEQAHAYGALVLIDGAQAGPHLRIKVQDLDADFYTLSCHKIYAPTGVGVLYGKRPLLEALPPYQGGGDMIRTVSFEGTTYAGIPAKFEAGTPNIAGVIGLGKSVEWLEQLGGGSLDSAFSAIEAHEAALRSEAEAGLAAIPGVQIVGTARDKAGIVSFTMESAHPHDIGTILDSEGIAIRAGHHCCMPLMTRFGIPATARASFALYNTMEEVERLESAVRKVQEMFA